MLSSNFCLMREHYETRDRKIFAQPSFSPSGLPNRDKAPGNLLMSLLNEFRTIESFFKGYRLLLSLKGTSQIVVRAQWLARFASETHPTLKKKKLAI